MLKLFYKSGACSLAPHILLNELQLDYLLEAVDFKTKTTEHGQDYLTINPKGVVPALELEPGVILTENTVVLQYLADLEPELKLLAPKGLERYRCLELVNFITTEIHKGFGPLFHLNDYAKAEAAQAELKASSTKF